jgi:hypothetical protein
MAMLMKKMTVESIVRKYGSERSVKPRRRVRRSMAELAASLQNSAVEDSHLKRPLAALQHLPARSLRQNASVTTNISLDHANRLAAAVRHSAFPAKRLAKRRNKKSKAARRSESRLSQLRNIAPKHSN